MAKVHLCVRAQDQTLSRHKDSVMLQVTGLNKNLGNHIVGFQPTSQLLLIIEKMSFITKCFETPLKVSKVLLSKILFLVPVVSRVDVGKG